MGKGQSFRQKIPKPMDEQKIARLSRLEMPGLNTTTQHETHSTGNGNGAIQRASLDPSTLTPQDAYYLL